MTRINFRISASWDDDDRHTRPPNRSIIEFTKLAHRVLLAGAHNTHTQLLLHRRLPWTGWWIHIIRRELTNCCYSLELNIRKAILGDISALVETSEDLQFAQDLLSPRHAASSQEELGPEVDAYNVNDEEATCEKSFMVRSFRQLLIPDTNIPHSPRPEHSAILHSGRWSWDWRMA